MRQLPLNGYISLGNLSIFW